MTPCSTSVEVTIEHESSIVLHLDETSYAAFSAKLKNALIDVIFYYQNENCRLHSRKYQQKVIKDKRFVLSFCEKTCTFFPITRKVAHERLIHLERLSKNNIEAVVLRYAVFIASPDIPDIRLSLNKVESLQGVRYNVSAEIEYTASLELTTLQRYEQKLMELMSSLFTDGVCTKFDNLSIKDLFFMVPPKLQFFTQFNPNVSTNGQSNAYVWAYKWDGVKAKLQWCQEADGKYICALCCDANEIQLFPQSEFNSFTNQQLNLLKQFCFQVEVMPELLVIVECLGTMVDEKPYNVERNTNLKILRYLKNQLNQQTYNLASRRIIVQEYYSPPMQLNFDKSKYDGLVILQNHQLIKFKIPTIDVKLQANGVFATGNAKVLPFITNPAQLDLKVGSIYEINANMEVVRHREDRNTHSTERELTVFQHAVEIFKSNKQIFTSDHIKSYK